MALGFTAARIVGNCRRQRQAVHLHNLGPRPILEALAEVALGADLDDVLERYSALDPDVMRKLAADRFWRPPLRRVV